MLVNAITVASGSFRLFTIYPHTAAYGSVRFLQSLAYGRFCQRSLLHSTPAHCIFWQRSPFSQLLAQQQPIAHGRFWQNSLFRSLLVYGRF